MSAFPPFSGFGSNTNPQGPGQLPAFFSGGLVSAPPKKLGPVKTMGPGQKPPGFGSNPLSGLQSLTSSLQGKANQLNKPSAPQSSMAGGVGMGGSVWDRNSSKKSINPSMRDAVAGSLIGDAELSQKTADFNWGRNEQGRQDFLRSNEEGVERLRGVGMGAADKMEADAQAGFDRSTGFADEAWNRMEKRVGETEARHEDRTAQDVADMNAGIMSQRASQLSQQIDELGLGGADPNDPQVAQVRQEFQAETMRMRQSAATQLISRNNEFRASFEQGNTQILAGVAGDSAQMKFQASQALTQYNQQAAQFRQAVEGDALNRKLQGDLAGYEMLVQNPYSPVALSGVLASIMEMMESGAGKYGNPLPNLV